VTWYQLAKLISLAGGKVRGRKRLQKMVFLLQEAGFPSDAEFRLHHYGPYSFDVAGMLTDLTRDGLLEEETCQTYAGTQFNYSLTEAVRRKIDAYEKTDRGARECGDIAAFDHRIQELAGEQDLWVLELAATIAFFYRRTGDWAKATERTCRFKGVSESDAKIRQALQLANETLSVKET
jgi:uncharacterized protein YwgA